MTHPTYHTSIQHSDIYYLRVIQGLLSGLKDGLSDKDMAAHLNRHGLLSATGRPWTVTAGIQALSKLRHSRKTSSHLHTAMLRLCFDGVLSKAQVLPLLTPRKSPQVQM
nr:hypothetical protein [uncultured Albidiferax sp.]